MGIQNTNNGLIYTYIGFDDRLYGRYVLLGGLALYKTAVFSKIVSVGSTQLVINPKFHHHHYDPISVWRR